MNSNLNSDEPNIDKKKFFEYNAALFEKRFPELAEILQLNKIDSGDQLLSSIPKNYQLLKCKKTHFFTLKIEEQFLHSRYDSLSEAKNLISTLSLNEKNSYTFCGLGLGYHVDLFLEKNPKASLTIVEPDIYVFLLFLSSRRLDSFFAHPNLRLLIGLSPLEVIKFLQATSTIEIEPFFLRSFEVLHKDWFREFSTLKLRILSRLKVNQATTKIFFSLWFKNTIKNLISEKNIYSIALLKNAFLKHSAIIFAAGPSLEDDISKLKDKLSNMIIIAVDTAARVLLYNGIVPHFVITGDPQYNNFQHLQYIDLTKTMLVAEATIFPATLRLNTKKNLIFSQGLPLVNELCKEIKKLNSNFSLSTLASGGSVATSAYSFALFLGVKKIIFSGLDLSFIDKKTHFRGSTFEEKTHYSSMRLKPSQTRQLDALFNSSPFFVASNLGAGEKVLTEKRMQMYAWWFESVIQSKPEDVKVFTLSEKGMAIPGIIPIKPSHIATPTPSVAQVSAALLDKALEKAFPISLNKAEVLASAKKILEKLETDKEFAEEVFLSDEPREILQKLKTFLKNQ